MQLTLLAFYLSSNPDTAPLGSAGEHITCKSVVITTGTFLRGVVHVGSKTKAAGRMPSCASQVAPAPMLALMPSSAHRELSLVPHQDSPRICLSHLALTRSH